MTYEAKGKIMLTWFASAIPLMVISAFIIGITNAPGVTLVLWLLWAIGFVAFLVWSVWSGDTP